MKRIFVIIAALVGVGGLIALLNYHPHNDSLAGSSGLPKASAVDSSASTNATPNSSTSSSTTYKNGTFTGSTEDVGYGTVQVQAVISDGKISGVNFLQMPSEASRSAMITNEAKPVLMQEAITAQSANVDLVTGATSDWEGFKASLQSALSQAQG